jgi:hypothetical protein
LHGKFFDILIPCDSKYCNCNVLVVDEKTSAHLQCVDLICFMCKHRRRISLENYNSICDHKMQRVMQIFNKAGLTEIFDKKTLMRFTHNVRFANNVRI